MKILFLVWSISLFRASLQVPCQDLHIDPCICFPTSKQIVCKGETLDADKLYGLFHSLLIEIDYLHIHDTNLAKIKSGTFEKSSFNKIFIVKNEKLTDIEDGAFKISANTTSLVIRDNKMLVGTNLFKIAKSMAKELTVVEFDLNAITEIPGNAFNDASFTKLKSIRLDKNHIVKVNAGAFGQLPVLEELSLDHNMLVKLDPNAIDLKGTTLTTDKHIILFLNDNQLTELKSDQVVYDFLETKPSIGLVLENNNLIDLKDSIGLIDKIVENKNGLVFLKGNTGIKCVCEDITSISDAITKNGALIKGLEAKPCHHKATEEPKLELKCK